MTFVYIVRRESADAREEIDTFAGTPEGWELAASWARLVGSIVEEESLIDMDTLEAMRRSYIQDDDDTGLDEFGRDNDGNRREYIEP